MGTMAQSSLKWARRTAGAHTGSATTVEAFVAQGGQIAQLPAGPQSLELGWGCDPRAVYCPSLEELDRTMR